MKHLQEYLNIEFSIGKKICRLISLYRSPSLNEEEFNTLLDNFESNLETVSLFTPFLTILIGDFNAIWVSWYSKDSNTTKSSQIRLLTSQSGLNQIISDPVGNYIFKVNNRNSRTRCEICSKLTIKTP